VQRMQVGALLRESVPGCGLAGAQAHMQALAGCAIVDVELLPFLCLLYEGEVDGEECITFWTDVALSLRHWHDAQKV
jgi:hypothetical protein